MSKIAGTALGTARASFDVVTDATTEAFDALQAGRAADAVEHMRAARAALDAAIRDAERAAETSN